MMKHLGLTLALTLASAATFAGTGWSYEGETGPAHWGDLSPAYAACKTGLEQSPVDLGAAREGIDQPEIKLNYKPQNLTVKNNGHAVQVDFDNSSKLKVGKDSYRLLQFHFHTGSEHTVNGRQYPLEAHFVHINDAGQLAVFGVMFEEGEANSELAKIIPHVPAEKGEVVVEGKKLNALKLIGDDSAEEYYTYSGSLTTPPCSEGVRWMVSEEVQTASAEQIEVLKHAVHGNNARPVQPLNARSLLLSDD
ncbi:carbonic anhydrase [Chitinibacteraceae bacterium HSL-7]